MSRPTNAARISRRGRSAEWPWLAAAGVILMVLPGLARAADPQRDQPDEKRPPAGAGKASAKETDSAKRPAAAPLRFTDEDLEKYRKPKVVAEEGTPVDGPDAEVQAVVPVPPPVAAAPPAAPPAKSAVPPKPAAAKRRPPAVKLPPRAAKPPAEDPLKPWKDREALEAFRSQQIDALRERIAGLQSRLGYLDQKRLAILDPLRIMPQARTAEEAAEDAARGPRDLLESVDQEIESVKVELEQARLDLIAIETRFAHESKAP